MPVGGIGAGLVYLGGDGRLWMWDIFNKQYARGFMGRGAGGDTYLNPFEQVHPFDQGFELRIEAGDDPRTFLPGLQRILGGHIRTAAIPWGSSATKIPSARSR